MKYLMYITTFLICLYACGGEKTGQTSSPGTDTTQAAKNSTTPTKAGYPSLTQEALMNIWDNGEMIDYIFHDLPFSMNQTELNSIRTNLTYIDPRPVSEIPTKCKPFARQFYQVGGDIVLESDIYFSEGCQFYVFWEDGKAKYANYMAESGVTFFNQMVKQAMQARQQNVPQ